MLTIIFKTGDSSTKDAKSYKSKRKNAKIENDKLCFHAVTDDEKKCTNKENNARGVCEFVSETKLILKRFTEPFESHKRIMLRRYHCLYEMILKRSRNRIVVYIFTENLVTL